MKTSIELPGGWQAGHQLSRHLKGYNLEMTGACHDGMLADRISNPKFHGPGDSFGLPPGWRGGSLSQCRVVPGLGYSGSQALLIAPPCSIRQGGIQVHAGEALEIDIVAKIRHAPVTLTFTIKTEAMRAGPLASASMVVDTPCWQSHKAVVTIPEDCNRAAFHVTAAGDGELHFDQVHLRPPGKFLAPRVVEAFRSLEMGALRFPGGCVSTVYDWRKGLGPIERRPVCYDPQFNGRIGYDFGIREFLTLCLELQCTPHLTIPLGHGTAEDAADLARYCSSFYDELGVAAPPILFQVGNEQYARHSLAHMSCGNYLALLRQISPALRANYPRCTVIGLYSFVSGDPWRAQILDEAGGLIDMLAYQYYKGQMKTTVEEQVRNAAESVAKNRSDLEDLASEIHRRGLNWKIGFTEWNYWLYANGLSHNGELYSVREPMDAAHCLFIAGMLQMQADLGAMVTLSNLYNLLNGMSVFEQRQGRFDESSAAEVLRFYSPAFPGRYVQTCCDAPLLGEKAPAVHTLCVKQGSTGLLYVLNYAAETLDVDLPAGIRGAHGEVLHFADSRLGMDVPPRKLPAADRLPPHSIARFRLEGLPA